MKDYVVRYSAYNDTVRVFCVDSTTTVETARLSHDLWPSATQALGRTLSILAIMSVMQKNNEQINIIINGKGPIGIITANSHKKGQVKGYVEKPHQMYQNNDGSINCSYAVGTNGVIEVTRDLGLKKPYTSSTQLVSGEIAEDFAYFFTSSEQVPSALSAGASLNLDGEVVNAGAFLIQIMPGCSDETITEIEENISKIPSMTTLLEKNKKPEDIVKMLASNTKFLDKTDVAFECDCSKEKFLNGIGRIGKKELRTIIEEDKKADLFCSFCSSNYHITEQELLSVLEEIE